MKYIYVIKGFDSNLWQEKSGIIAFETENEARKYCELHSHSGASFCWDKVVIGKMKPPYPKKPKLIHILP